jgi:hypothetical protein
VASCLGCDFVAAPLSILVLWGRRRAGSRQRRARAANR